MTSFIKVIFCLTIPVFACSLTGCQDDPAKQGGTYTAARHMGTGSHVPQRADVASTSSVYAPPTESSSISANNGSAGNSYAGAH